MARGPIFLVAIALLAACGPGASSPAPSPSTSAAAAPATSVKAGAFTDCPVTRPVTNERPKNSNTAAFSSAWYVSPDRLLWASAGYRLWAGRTGNKVLWERPGTAVSISGKLLNGDAKAAGVPTITGPSGYETQDYQRAGSRSR